MAKALIGYMSSDLRNNARMALEKLVADNRALRARIAELEALVTRLQDENATLTSAQAAALLEPIEEMQPA
jgi:cell division septum initiation protein DivIVA